ncbi:MAG: hypothetical protein HY393_03115 [Candidatus Diapherotrites archaeon]|nr:hypothetical protein [Candidatus Diapherotrites archaeon]
MVRWEDVEEIDKYVTEKEKSKKGAKKKKEAEKPRAKSAPRPSMKGITGKDVLEVMGAEQNAPSNSLQPSPQTSESSSTPEDRKTFSFPTSAPPKPKRVEYGVEDLQIEGLKEAKESSEENVEEDKEMQELSRTSEEVESGTLELESKKMEEQRARHSKGLEGIPDNPFQRSIQKQTPAAPVTQTPVAAPVQADDKAKALEEMKRLVAEKQRELERRKKQETSENAQSTNETEWHYD